MTDRGLRLDSAGHPHVAYGGDHLYYAWHDGMRWHYEVADNSPQVGDGASLALDAEGRPHIAYGQVTPAAMGIQYTARYAYRDATGWHTEAVNGVEGFPGRPSLAVDGQGRPHLAVLSGSGVTYAYRDDLGWHVELLDQLLSGSSGYGDVSLALDGSGWVHVSYTLGGLKYAYRDAAGWHVESVPGAGGADFSTSLALDGAGQPHIAYVNTTQSPPDNAFTTCHAYHDAEGWHVETIDPVHNVGASPSLAVDGVGWIHVSYYDYEDALHTTFKYAFRDEQGWHAGALPDSALFAGDRSSLAVDDAGAVHIAYEVGYFQDLYYGFLDASGWQSELVDSSGYLGQGNSLALDESGYPHISYLDVAGMAARYAYLDGSGWHRETVDQVAQDWVSVLGNTSLTLDGEGRPHLTYPFRSCSDTCETAIKYAYQDGAGWHVETVAGASDVYGRSSALVLDGDGRPHVTFYGEDGLKYASQDASGWQVETLLAWADPWSIPNEPPSMVMDDQGFVHLSCAVGSAREIVYAYQSTSGWHLEPLPGGDYVPSATSLAVDGNGHAHIAYVSGDAGYYLLRYAYRDAAGWHTQTVPGAPPTWRPSLALDKAGWPRIVCLDSSSTLNYFYQDSSGWHLETATGPEGLAEPLSLALDGRADPHLSCWLAEGGLGYARGHLHADLSASAKAGQPGVEAGGRLAYRLALVNSGREPAAFVLTDPLPALTTYVPGSLSVAGGTVEAGQGITWTGTLGAFDRLTATFAVTVADTLAAPTAIVNVATLAGDPLGVLSLQARNLVNGSTLYLPLVYKSERAPY